MRGGGALWLAALCAALQASGVACAPAGVTEVTTRNFDEVTKAHDTLLLVFYAPWCGHCKRLEPALSELAQSHDVAKADGTEHRVLAARFGVRGYPSLFLIKSRGDVYGYEGDRGAKALDAFIKSGHRTARRLSLLKSPFGPLGRAKGLCTALGLLAQDQHAALATSIGEYAAYAVVGTVALLLVIAVVVIPVLILA